MNALEDATAKTAEESSRDLRMGGAWSMGQRLKNDALFVLALSALALSRALPLVALRGVGKTLGAAAYTLARGARRTARANVDRAFPGMAEADRRALVRRSFVTMGELLADAVALLRTRGGPLLELTPDARAVLEGARREGHGVVFASAHLGPWERVAASLVAAGLPFTTVARESYDPRFSRLYEKLRGARGVRVVWRSKRSNAASASSASSASSLAVTAGILRVLRASGVLGVPMDLASRVPSVRAPFLGHPAPTAVGPARIALRTGAAVVVGTIAPGPPARKGGSPFVITATRIPTDGLDSSTDGGALELTTRINQELSARIRALPHAWVWMHERWTVPDGYTDTID